jgi:hypothetical protein
MVHVSGSIYSRCCDVTGMLGFSGYPDSCIYIYLFTISKLVYNLDNWGYKCDKWGWSDDPISLSVLAQGDFIRKTEKKRLVNNSGVLKWCWLGNPRTKWRCFLSEYILQWGISMCYVWLPEGKWRFVHLTSKKTHRIQDWEWQLHITIPVFDWETDAYWLVVRHVVTKYSGNMDMKQQHIGNLT